MNSNKATQSKKILCIGGGLLGLPVAESFSQSHDVTVIKRSPIESAYPITVNCADIGNKDALSAALPAQIDLLLICLSPSEYSENGYLQVFDIGIRNIINAIKEKNLIPSRVFFISSTSVYHQNDDSLVDESSPTLPQSYSGKILLGAESLLENSEFTTSIIRFSGIYGGNRIRLIEQALNGNYSLQGNDKYSNRIHETDCISIIKHLMSKALENEPLENRYLATDCAPVTYDDLYSWFREKMICKAPDKNTPPQKRRAGSKRCSNQRILDSGFKFLYPSWKEGYGEMIARLYKSHAK